MSGSDSGPDRNSCRKSKRPPVWEVGARAAGGRACYWMSTTSRLGNAGVVVDTVNIIDPIGTLRSITDACGLSWTADFERGIDTDLKSANFKWRETLPPESK